MASYNFEVTHRVLNIYERILPEWDPSSKKLGLMPSIWCRQAAICAAHLGDWEKAATFFEDGAKRAKENYGTEQYIGLYADAGFAQFKAGNVRDSMNLLSVALQEFEMLPQDDTDVGYFTLKKLLGYSITWLAQQNKKNNIKSVEPPPGFCSDPVRDDEIMNYPNFPIQYTWLHLAQVEYQFNLGMTIFEQTLQVTDQNVYPALRLSLVYLKAQQDFRNKTFDELPQRMCQLAEACVSAQKHEQSGKGIEEKGVYVVSTAELSNFASVENIIDMLVAALLVQLSTNRDTNEILSIWRANSSELLVKKNMTIALDLIESMLFGEEKNALIVMRTKKAKREDRVMASLKIVYNIETDPKNLFYAHTLIATSLIDKTWGEHVVTNLAELFSKQWLKKIKFQAVLETPRITVPQIEQACNSSETGKKKIGQILLAAHQAVSVQLSPDILLQLKCAPKVDPV